ncbi:MAG: DUF1588 domain-containing protein, partial [Lentisphaeraceae bacterium]|nr:DUF1588 domain-containing protein [Lentisphaeraceae bacterium]
ESNPVKRGNWFARKIISEPPGEPAANVPDLKEIRGNFTLRQKLEMHRSKKACKNCHKKIDPWGIPFEVFDAAGFKKDKAEAQSELPDGTQVNGLDELKDYLLKDRMEQVAFSFIQHLSTYAIGRELSFKEIDYLKIKIPTLKKRGYRMQDIIKFIINSQIFLKK